MTNSASLSSLSPFLDRYTADPYANRTEAGTVLAERIRSESPFANPVVLALPRGGVPVACEVAKQLSFSFDIFLVRKFAVPEHPEMPAGIAASGGVHIVNPQSNAQWNRAGLREAITREQAEIIRRELSYRGARPAEPVAGRTVFVVDDGLTTGATMRAAVSALRLLKPARIIAAIPVGSAEVCEALSAEADSVICCRTPASFFSVSRCYRDFSPVLDDEIRNLLASVSPEASISAFRA